MARTGDVDAVEQKVFPESGLRVTVALALNCRGARTEVPARVSRKTGQQPGAASA